MRWTQEQDTHVANVLHTCCIHIATHRHMRTPTHTTHTTSHHITPHHTPSHHHTTTPPHHRPTRTIRTIRPTAPPPHHPTTAHRTPHTAHRTPHTAHHTTPHHTSFHPISFVFLMIRHKLMMFFSTSLSSVWLVTCQWQGICQASLGTGSTYQGRQQARTLPNSEKWKSRQKKTTQGTRFLQSE